MILSIPYTRLGRWIVQIEGILFKLCDKSLPDQSEAIRYLINAKLQLDNALYLRLLFPFWTDNMASSPGSNE